MQAARPAGLVDQALWANLLAAAGLAGGLPAKYPRLRPFLLVLLRLNTLLPSSIWYLQAGVMDLLLGAPPSSGPAGIAVDTLRLLLGMRLLPATILTLAFPLPLPLAAVTHISATLRLGYSSPYCSHPLLRHPLMKRRLEWLWAVMDASSHLVSPLGAALDVRHVSPARSEAEVADQQCVVALTFLQLAFALLPVVVLAWQRQGARQLVQPEQQEQQQWQQQAELEQWAAASSPLHPQQQLLHAVQQAAEDASDSSGSAGATTPRRAARGLPKSRRLRAALRLSDCAIRALCLCDYGWGPRAGASCYMLSLLWLFAKAVS